MLYTRDLRTRDLPALHDAANADRVLPVFVFDDEVLDQHHSPNRVHVLVDALADLRVRLQELGADLVIRRGDWTAEVVRLAEAHDVRTVHVSEDVSAVARRRLRCLREALPDSTELRRHPGVTVVPPGSTAPSSGAEWKVFTPYLRNWSAQEWREVLPPPDRLRLPEGVDPGELPEAAQLCAGDASPELPAGGESVALVQLRTWAADDLATYDEHHDDLAADRTSRISVHLHLGCLSPLEVATRLRDRDGGGPFVRQLCWRDFYHQVLAARPAASSEDYRARGDRWRDDTDELEAWKAGMTGFPLVDAGMRQLRREGFMHNRARMVVASFLSKDLYQDWRVGARHFMRWLVDGDVANNQLNWQWTAGTGTDSNPNRIFNPTVQSQRFDPDGNYIRRYVEELADVAAPEIHEPTEATRTRTGYPAPLVDHREAIAAYKELQSELRS